MAAGTGVERLIVQAAAAAGVMRDGRIGAPARGGSRPLTVSSAQDATAYLVEGLDA